MTRNRRMVVAGCALVCVQAAQVKGQTYRADLGVNGGRSWYSRSLTASDIGSQGGGLKFGGSWQYGSQATLWVPGFGMVSRVGLRLNLGFTDTDLSQVVEGGANVRLHDNINVWHVTGDLMFGLRQPHEVWTGPELLPYVTLGAGMKWVDPRGSEAKLTGRVAGHESIGFPITCMAGTCTATTINPPGGTGTGTVPGRTNLFFANENVPTLLAGLGGDIRLTPAFAIRVEGGDRLWKAPVHRTDPPSANFPSAQRAEDGSVGRLMNELYLHAGITMLVGLSRPPVGALMSAPVPVSRGEASLLAVPVPIPMKGMRVHMSHQNTSAPVQAALPRQETEGERMAGVLEEPVLFEYGRSDLSDGAKETLLAKVVILASHSRVRLEIAGYADARGTLRYNQALGQRRAQALCDYLIHAGLSRERFEVISHGKERQLTGGATEIDYALNRRGEFTVLSGLPDFEKR